PVWLKPASSPLVDIFPRALPARSVALQGTGELEMVRAESPDGDSGWYRRSRAARTAVQQRALAAADAGLAAAHHKLRDLEERLAVQVRENDRLRSVLFGGESDDLRGDELRRRWRSIESVLRAQLQARDGVLEAPLTDADILLRNLAEHSAQAPGPEVRCQELRSLQKSARLAPPFALADRLLEPQEQLPNGVEPSFGNPGADVLAAHAVPGLDGRGGFQFQFRFEAPALVPGAGSWARLDAAGARCTCGATVFSSCRAAVPLRLKALREGKCTCWRAVRCRRGRAPCPLSPPRRGSCGDSPSILVKAACSAAVIMQVGACQGQEWRMLGRCSFGSRWLGPTTPAQTRSTRATWTASAFSSHCRSWSRQFPSLLSCRTRSSSRSAWSSWSSCSSEWSEVIAPRPKTIPPLSHAFYELTAVSRFLMANVPDIALWEDVGL
ncbi:unnamed protein product, partial [Prorocentrum cordatum]